MRKLLIILVLFSSIFVFASCICEENPPINEMPKMYKNPVFEPVLADPSIIRADDGYIYAFGTADYSEWGEDFGTKYGPIIRSKDLIDWEFVGEVFNKQSRPVWGTPNAGVWAPDVVLFNSTYNYYYSLSTWGDTNPGIGIATASHPAGPWTDHGKMFTSLEIGVNNSIDPTVFFDKDGTPYMIWGSYRGLYGGELSSDGLSFKDANINETKTHVAGLDTSTPFNAATYEGAYVIYINGYYYMFVSSGNCCSGHTSSYNVKVGRSTSPLGPYYDHTGLDMFAANRGYQVLKRTNKVGGPGHNSIIKDDENDYWIVYHAFDTSKPEKVGNTQRRALFIDKLVWNETGWPSVEGTIPSIEEKLGPRFNWDN